MKIKNGITFVLTVAALAVTSVTLMSCTGEGQPVRITIPGTEWQAPTAANAAETAAPAENSEAETQAEENAAPETSSQRGLVTADGKSYFYDSQGVLQKNGIVGSDSDGWYYADSDGVIDMGYCDGVSFDGADWNVIEGKAAKVSGDSDAMLHHALQAVAKCTNSGMTRDEKLKSAFDYIKTAYLEGVRHDPPYQEMDWPVVYAEDIFVYGKGDCFSYGAAYAYMAKGIGCENVYACNSGGHGWAEVDGKFYDPEWDMHHNEYNHFAVGPNDESDVGYTTSLMDGVEWMRIKL